MRASSQSSIDEITLAKLAEWERWYQLREGRWFYFLAKTLIDRALAIALLALLAPLLALLAAAIFVESGTPVLFLQRRYGLFGMPFRVFKFKTLTESGGQLKATRIGRVMRKYKLDELPQLLNVILGSMSLVGPRPLCKSDMVRISHRRLDRFAVKPGLTGLWQALHTNLIPISRKQRLDSIYARKCSLALDFWLLYRTPAVVLQGEDQWIRNNEPHTKPEAPTRKAG